MKRARRLKAHIFAKHRDGHYVEPAWCSRRLLEEETFDGSILDPACGWGTILAEARAFGHSVFGFDKVDRLKRALPIPRRRFHKLNFLKDPLPFQTVGNVICNPPFDHVEEFCRRALEIAESKVAMIMLLRRLPAAGVWLRTTPLEKIYYLTPRPSMPPGSYIASGKKPGGGSQDFCWLVFRKGHRGPPQARWLNRDGGLNGHATRRDRSQESARAIPRLQETRALQQADR